MITEGGELQLPGRVIQLVPQNPLLRTLFAFPS
jgi:hypothetical protein